MDNVITTSGISFAYGERAALSDISLAFPRGRITVLAGANGSGKSTLLRAVRRIVKPTHGSVALEETDIATMGAAELARHIALLVQTPSAPEDLTVFDLVKLGRYPHQSFFAQWSAPDQTAVEQAIAATGLTELRDRRLDTLSGGQRQRAWISMVLAQDTPVVCLDEPINHLDVAYQLDCLDLLRRLNREQSKTIIVVLHDLNLASRYADRLVVMKNGALFAQGTPQELMTEALIRDAFGIESRIIADPVHGCPLCIPVASLHSARE